MIESFLDIAKQYINYETMAADFLAAYFGDDTIVYPINPFEMLKDSGVEFLFRKFKKLEGVYIPASDETDIPIVAINFERPITRQRFTAAHELCHHFRDRDRQVSIHYTLRLRKRKIILMPWR